MSDDNGTEFEVTTAVLGFQPFVLIQLDDDGQVSLQAGGLGSTPHLILRLIRQALPAVRKQYRAMNRAAKK